MKWYHYLMLASMALFVLGVEQRLMLGSASVWLVIGSIPGLIYVSSKGLEIVTRNTL